MNWNPFLSLPVVAAFVAPSAQATVYLTTEQAQQIIFGSSNLALTSVQLTDAQRETMREKSSVREPFKTDRIWRIPGGGFFIIDEVVGKHETIKYAVGLNTDGSVRQVEIMEYNESYGYEIRDEAWRKQFIGKTATSPLKLNQDIRNISGATLSCKHVTDGIKRVLIFYDLVLKNLL